MQTDEIAELRKKDMNEIETQTDKPIEKQTSEISTQVQISVLTSQIQTDDLEELREKSLTDRSL